MVHDKNEDSRFGQAIVLFGIACVLMVTIGFPTQAISTKIGLVITLVFVLLLPAIIFSRWKGVPVRGALRLRRISPALVAASLLAGAGGWAIAATLAMSLQKAGLPSLPVAGMSPETPAALLILLFVGALMPGVCEECFFRGAIQGILERRGKWFAIVLSAVLFGLFHMDPIRIVAASVLGIFFGWLVVRTGSLYPAILAHLANNAMAISASYFLSGRIDTANWLLLILAVLWVASMFVIVRITGSDEFRFNIESSPLSRVPAGLHPGVAWGCGIPGVLAGVGFIAGIFALSMLITATTIDDALAPEIGQGDQVVLMKANSPLFDLNEGQVVVIEVEGQTLARRVSRIEDDRVWVVDTAGDETEISTSEIIGSLIQKL